MYECKEDGSINTIHDHPTILDSLLYRLDEDNMLNKLNLSAQPVIIPDIQHIQCISIIPSKGPYYINYNLIFDSLLYRSDEDYCSAE